MLIETTLHVHKNILHELDRVVSLIGESRNSIIKFLIQRIMHDNKRMIKTYSRIKYQKRDLKENWRNINVVFNEYEYEYCQDMRKFFKMSVSLILAYAVLRYLDEVINKEKSTDNYLYCNYILVQKIINDVICWQIYWGIPPQLNIL